MICIITLKIPKFNNTLNTRIHSSRMRNVRCSGRHGGCLPVEGVCLWRVSACGGCLPVGGVCLVSATPPPSACWDTHSYPVHAGIHTSPMWTEFLTHACENKPTWWTNTVLWRYFVIFYWSTCCCCDRYELWDVSFINKLRMGLIVIKVWSLLTLHVHLGSNQFH